MPSNDDDSSAGGENPVGSGPNGESRKPMDTALRQQRMKAWQPILDPAWVIAALAVLGVGFIATGVIVDNMSNKIIELSTQYDAYDNRTNTTGCQISQANANVSCQLNFVVPEEMKPPVLVHYEIDNFYQNHRRYVKSRDDIQLRGDPNGHDLGQKRCKPLLQLGNQTLNPCGLIANTLFNDVITLLPSSTTVDTSGNPLVMREDGIAWETDLRFKFGQVQGFQSQQCSGGCGSEECTCSAVDEEGNRLWSCKEPYVDENGECFLYFYPQDDTTTYLYETYPMVVNPLEGVTNEHFVVWMRTAALPKFRKLYGWINQPIPANTILTFAIQANWDVTSFQGRKSLLLSTNNAFGGKNPFLGRYFWILGVCFCVLGVLFGVKHVWKPRKLGDERYLKYKED